MIIRTDFDNTLAWLLTAESCHHVDEWRRMHAEEGYKSDFWWFIT